MKFLQHGNGGFLWLVRVLVFRYQIEDSARDDDAQKATS